MSSPKQRAQTSQSHLNTPHRTLHGGRAARRTPAGLHAGRGAPSPPLTAASSGRTYADAEPVRPPLDGGRAPRMLSGRAAALDGDDVGLPPPLNGDAGGA